MVIRTNLYLFSYAKFSTQFVVVKRLKLPQRAGKFPPLKFITRRMCQELTTTIGLFLVLEVGAGQFYVASCVAIVTQVIALLRSTYGL